MSGSGKEANVNQSKGVVASAKHTQDITVKTGSDNSTCTISGLVFLSDGRLVIADNSGNHKIKTVDVQSGQVLSELKLSSRPWDVTVINNNKVAVTLSNENKVAIVTVGDDSLNIDRTLAVSGLSGECRGIDYRNGKLAVSFLNPQQVQVLNLQGTVLYTISPDKQGTFLFNTPYYLTFGQDDTSLYVSNCKGNSVVCVKLDGTLVATYRDSDLKSPLKPVVDSNGNVYVCSYASNQVHQISNECRKLKVLLTQADGLGQPYSMCLSKEDDKLYVGMYNNDNVRVYTIEHTPQ